MAEGRTTITIARKLGSVRSTDAISCVDSGSIKERGSQNDRMHRSSAFYRALFETQGVQKATPADEKVTATIGTVSPAATTFEGTSQ